MRDAGVVRSKSYEQHPARYLTYNGTELMLRGRHGPEKVRCILDDYEAGASPAELAERYDAPASSIEKWTERAGVARSRQEAAAQCRVNEGRSAL